MLRTITWAAVVACLSTASVPAFASPADTSAGGTDALLARSAVHIDFVRYDPAGSDSGSNRHLNREIVIVENRSGRTKRITGWTLRDPAGHVYRFPGTRLRPGRHVTVHTGSGRNNPGDRYWGQSNYVWNNTGDRAILRNKNGARVDTCAWGDGDGTTAC